MNWNATRLVTCVVLNPKFLNVISCYDQSTASGRTTKHYAPTSTNFEILLTFPCFLISWLLTLRQLTRELFYKVYYIKISLIYLWQINRVPTYCIVSLYHFLGFLKSFLFLSTSLIMIHFLNINHMNLVHCKRKKDNLQVPIYTKSLWEKCRSHLRM